MRNLYIFIIILVCIGFIIYNDEKQFLVKKNVENINIENVKQTVENMYSNINNAIEQKEEETQAIVVKNSEKDTFLENFSQNFILEETGRMERSKSLDWWVNSGAFLYFENGVGRTIFGSLERGSKWQIRFSQGKNDIPSETDGGFYPQNIFRLITKSKWRDFQQEAYYRIKEYNLSKDKHRRESNGLLLFNRYQDGFNLYYTGIRVDGEATIKKKYKGEYYTMAQEIIFDGEYDRKTNPNLLPVNKWIGVKSEVKTIDDKKVEIKVFIDKENNKNWELVLEAVDDNKSYGGESILNEGYAGIRTDFMDVEFDNFKITKIEQ